MMKSESEWNVFLCHNSQEKPQVEKIRHALQEQGIKTWLDKYDFEPFRPWPDQLEEVIGQIKSAAIFIGSSGVGPWQDIEMKSFLNEFVSRELRMGLVVLPGCSNELIQKVPRLYKHFQLVDFRQQNPDPMGQLFWAITGKKFAEYLNDKLEALTYKKDILEYEIREIKNKLDEMSSSEEQLDAGLKSLLDWLVLRESIAEKCGAAALEKFPRLKQEVESKNSSSRFFLEISTCLECILEAIKRNDNIFVDEPALQPELTNLNVYAFATLEIYEEAFNMIKKRIPTHIDTSARNRLESCIDYAVSRLLMDA